MQGKAMKRRALGRAAARRAGLTLLVFVLTLALCPAVAYADEFDDGEKPMGGKPGAQVTIDPTALAQDAAMMASIEAEEAQIQDVIGQVQDPNFSGTLVLVTGLPVVYAGTWAIANNCGASIWIPLCFIPETWAIGSVSIWNNHGEFDGIGSDLAADGGVTTGGGMTSGVLEMTNVDLSEAGGLLIPTAIISQFQGYHRIVTDSDDFLNSLVEANR